MGGFVILDAPFRIVELDPSKTTNPVLTQRIKSLMTLKAWRSEFDQQVNYNEGSSFAVVRMMKFQDTRESTLNSTQLCMLGAAFLILQSKRNGEWRRVGCFSIQVLMSPEPVDKHAALLEEMRVKKWKWRKF